MSQHSFSIADEAGAAYRADVNNALQALASVSRGATAPATIYIGMYWEDTTANLLKRRNAANSAWIVVGSLDEAFVVSRASNTILGLSDYGKTFVATAGFTQTLTAAATLGDGWQVGYRIEAGVTVVFDPNASENIDGVATKSVTGPAGGTIRCDGSGFKTVGLDIVPVANGGTGSTSAASALSALGGAPVASPTFTGTPLETMGTGSGTAALIGKAHANTTAVGNVGTGADDLMTYSLPANSLSSNGKGVRVSMWGTTALNANAKTLNIYFGTTALKTFVLPTNAIVDWSAEYIVLRSGAGTQKVVFKGLIADQATVLATDTVFFEGGGTNQDDTAALTIKATGTATADNDIVQNGMLVEYIG